MMKSIKYTDIKVIHDTKASLHGADVKSFLGATIERFVILKDPVSRVNVDSSNAKGL